MEDFTKQILEIVQFQQTQQLELEKKFREEQLRIQKETEEKQLRIQKETEEKQLRIQKENEEERKKERKENEEKHLNLLKFLEEKERKKEEERERERVELCEQLMAMQVKSDQRLELLTQAFRNKNVDDENAFSQSAIWAAIDTFHHEPEKGLTFENYYRRFEDTFKVDCSQWSDAKKSRLLLRKLGQAEHEKFVDYILPKKSNELTFDETIKLLTELYGTKSSLFHKRWVCLNLKRTEEQDYVTFASVVNKHCDDFKLSSLSIDNFKCLVFTQGLIEQQDSEIRRRALVKMEAEPDLTVQKLAEDCQRHIAVKRESKNIEAGIAHIHKIHGQNKPPSKYRRGSKPLTNKPRTQSHQDKHLKSQIPVKVQIRCHRCDRIGHKATQCRVRLGKTYVKMAKVDPPEGNIRKYVYANIRGKEVKLQLDSGSDISIINYATYKRIGKPLMIKPTKIARSVTGEKIYFEGETIVDVSLKGKSKKLKVFVLRNASNLFGTDWISEFELWDSPMNNFCNKVEGLSAEADKLRTDLKEKFPTVFADKLGQCTKVRAKLELRDDHNPVFKKPRSVPFASREKIENELDRLVEIGVLTPVNYSEWAAPTVYVKKKSKEIRVCADFSTGLNAMLKDHHYPLPNPEEVFARLNGGKIFSKIDLSEAYLQIPMEEQSSKLLCISTHKGLFKFNRLAFGVKTAPAIFQQIIDTMLAGLDYSIGYLDDILMRSKDTEEHRAHVFGVFKRIQEYGFTLKDAKCEFFLEEIKYLGHIIDANGCRPDPERAAAIRDMPAPHNVATLQSFLGLASYYQKFIKDMHVLRAPLNELLKKDKEFKWTAECQAAFEKLKKVLTSDLFLTHFNPDNEIIVATDASSYGIGACILHKMADGSNKPIAHASRTLLPAERNYSQIEKEALGIIFGVTKFHRYIHGRRFTLQTDHKPLISIFGSKKGLPTYTANRLQRWGTILLNYNFNIEFLSSAKLGHADGLSRLIPKHNEPLEETVIASLRSEKNYSQILFNAVKELPVTLRDIIREAENDNFIMEMKQKINSEEAAAEGYSVCNEALMHRERVVVPTTLQKKILKDFHAGHPGATRTKNLMKSYVYWRGMDKDIEDMVKTCRGCALAAKAPPIKISPWPKTDHPWQRIHIDFAGPLEGNYYLVVVDSYTKWPEVFRCKSPTTVFTVSVLHELFARFGVVDCIVSDNGTQFTSTEFKEFCEEFQINHLTTPTYHPRSNGQAERFVDTLKRALKKAKGTPSERALQQFLQVYRITPNESAPAKMAPAELMFARKIRPVFDKLLPKHIKPPTSTIPKKVYLPGEKVFFQNQKDNVIFWELGKVQKRIGQMIYLIEGPTYIHKKHSNQIRKRYTEDEVQPPEQEEIMDQLYDSFDLEQPKTVGPRRSSRKRKMIDPIMVLPNKRSYTATSAEAESSEGGVVGI